MRPRLTRHAHARARQRGIPEMVIAQVYDDPDTVRISRSSSGREFRSRADDEQVIEVVVGTGDPTDDVLVGVEFLSPSLGVDLSGIPRAAEMEKVIRGLGFPVVSSGGDLSQHPTGTDPKP